MDTDDNFNIVDRSANKYNAVIDHAEILHDLYSDNCPEPDGTADCPYQDILIALEAA